MILTPEQIKIHRNAAAFVDPPEAVLVLIESHEALRAELERVSASLREVRERKDQRIVELIQARENRYSPYYDPDEQRVVMSIDEHGSWVHAPRGTEPLPTCAWSADDEGVYQTSCWNSFQFVTDGPKENGAKFCCYCGKTLVDKANTHEVE